MINTIKYWIRATLVMFLVAHGYFASSQLSFNNEPRDFKFRKAGLTNFTFQDDEKKSSYLIPGIYLNFRGGIDLTAWFPKNNVKVGEPIVFTQTQGIAAYNIKGQLGFHSSVGYKGITKNIKFTILSLGYDGPFRKTETQMSIFDERKFKSRGIERLVGFIDSRGILQLLGVSDKLKFLGVRYTYTREVFQGTSTAQQTFAFMPEGSVAVTNPENGNTYALGLIPYYKDDVLSYQSVFVDQEYSLPLFEMVDSDRGVIYSFRVGMFRSDWRKPSNNDSEINLAVIDWVENTWLHLPVIFDSKFQSTGFLIALEDNSSVSNIFINYQLRMAFKNKLIISDAMDEMFVPGSGFHYATKINFGYRFSVGKEAERFNSIVGFEYDARTFRMVYNHFEVVTKDKDFLFRIYARFNLFL